MNAPVDITNIRIETDRLLIRPWQEDDLEDFFTYAGEDGVGQMAGWQPHKSQDESKAILDLFIKEKKTLALELKEKQKVIGSLSLDEQDEDVIIPENTQGRELGFALNKIYWGRGLMPEAVKSVINYCFMELKYDWLCCGHFVWNTQSKRVIEKCGFHYLKDIIFDTRSGTKELGKTISNLTPISEVNYV